MNATEELRVENIDISLKRLKIISCIMLLLSIYLFYNDYIMMKKIDNISYRTTLFYIHIGIVVLSLLYLSISMLLEKFSSKLNGKAILIKEIFVLSYIPSSMLIGIALSLNSLKMIESISIYTTIILFIMMFFPFRPICAAIIVSIMHIGFLIGLSKLGTNPSTILINQINATVSIVVSIVLNFTFYRYGKTDFTNQKKLMERERNVTKLFEINPFPLFIYNLSRKKTVNMNKKAMDYYDVNNIDNFNPGDYFLNRQDIKYIFETVAKDSSINGYVMEQIVSGIKSWVMINCEKVNYEGEDSILIGVLDITKIKLLENELTLKASVDQLTGTINRLKGMDLLLEIYKQRNYQKRQFAIVFCDINSLKQINDEFGHAEGDNAIYIISNIITRSIDKDDILFRYGGDEFIIIMTGENKAIFELSICNIKNNLEEYNMLCKKPYKLSVSLGLEIINPELGLKLDEIIGNADKKMYHSKNEYYKNLRE